MTPIRIAMWSGPRNISTAMMRSFENRSDCAVWDEPFYAPYLKALDMVHPMQGEIMARHEADPDKVAAMLMADSRAPIIYIKLLTQQTLPQFSTDWFKTCRHAFLIRDPDAVIASYIKKRPDFDVEEIGILQQLELFDFVTDMTGDTPPVVEGNDILKDPEGMLSKLCSALDIPFSDSMLSWPPGRRADDGAWAPHWYDAVDKSTGFGPPRDETRAAVPDRYQDMAARCRAAFLTLRSHKLTPA